MSSTTPGSDPERRDLDGDGVADEHEEARRSVDPTASSAEDVDRLEPAVPASSDVAGEPPQEAVFTGTDETATSGRVEGDTVVHDQSELDAAVERARTEHPPVVHESPDPADRTDTTAMQRDDLLAGGPEPVRAEDVRRETGVPETVGATGVVGGAAAAASTPPTAAEPPTPQAVYVQAPPAPRTRGNRGFGVLVGLLATVLFALLYAGISYLVILAQNTPSEAARVFGQFAAQPVYWIPVLFFFIAFALLALALNRGAWWTWAVFGLLVGVIVYLSYIGGSLLTVAAWQFSPAEAADFVGQRWLDPFAIIAFIVARELPIWFGGWIAARGRTVAERNRVAREEYERQLAAGPQPITSR
jgi:hypothetical protein